MLYLKQPIIVEGKYDKIKLEGLVDALILTTDGFGIYKDKEKMALIRAFAERDGVILLTDSDAAGFQIRSFLKGSIPKGKIFHAYIPDIFGREKRKSKPSKEGKLGVEGMPPELLEKAFIDAGVLPAEEGSPETEKREWLTRADLLDDGLIGSPQSASLRKKLLRALGLPERLNVSGLLDVLNRLYTREQYLAALRSFEK